MVAVDIEFQGSNVPRIDCIAAIYFQFWTLQRSVSTDITSA